MSISLVQSNYGNTGGAGSVWNATLGTAATAGNTLFLAAFSYDTGSAISAGTPTYNGSSYPGASQLISECSTSSGNVFATIWMFPNVSGGGTTLTLTCTNGNLDGNVGWMTYEVSGLGTNPAVDRSSGGFASSGDTTSGTTSAIQGTNEFIIGASIGYAVQQAAASGFTNLWNYSTSGYCESGYQIATSSGGTYTYKTYSASTNDWAAGIVTIMPQTIATTAFIKW